MRMNRKQVFCVLVALSIATGYMLIQKTAWAHCDTMNGPVVPEAQAALEKGDVTPMLKWVRKQDEPEIKAAFNKAVAVRAKGDDARELADRYFLETFVRIHRAGEGAPYTGLKDEPVDPILAMADKAIETGSPDDMIEAISNHMAKEIRAKFEQANEAKKHKDESVEAGREYVKAYVTYVHYVEAIHGAIASAASPHAHSE